MFTLNLLGPFSALSDGRPFDRFGTMRGQALLIYLALEGGRAHQREALMHLLWPDMPLKSAQGNLRQTLYLLRKTWQDEGLAELPFLSDRQTIQLNPDLPLTVDVQQFLEALAAGTPAARQEAADRYRGSFLSDFFLPDSEPFEEWVAAKRAAFARLALDNLDQLTAHHLAQADYAAAESTARRAIALDDLHEPAHRQLLQALAGDGNRGQALAHYASFTHHLAQELGIEPDESTKQLVESIRTGQHILATSGAQPELAESPGDSAFDIPHSALQNLPAQTKPFIGREAELLQLDHFYAVPDIRLVTILGPGGMGKTQLAIEWARRQAEDSADGQQNFPDGAHFVDLAPLESLDQIAPAIAEVLAFPLEGEKRSPEQQMVDYLRQKKLLLILDNFEQLTDAASFVNDILRAAPGVFILVTSRERLQLSTEQVTILDGLSYPADPDQPDLESFTAVQLFLRSARRILPTHEAAAADWQPIARICRTTAGMPLAIELAAAWIDLLPVSEIADEIERRLDVLETDMRDIPDRHRSIRAAIDTTWEHLGPDEQYLFALLSIFRGDFTWEAVKAVLGWDGGDLRLRRALSDLRDKSLLQYNDRATRFTIHELLRQYAAEKLRIEQLWTEKLAAVKDGEEAAARQRHALYYADLLAACESGLKGAHYAESLQLIESDLENILAAWDWLIANERRSELAAAMDSLGLYHEIQGTFTTGRRNFRSLATRWQERIAAGAMASEEAVTGLRFLSKTLAWQSSFELDQDEAESLLQQSLALLDDPRFDGEPADSERAFIYYRLGHTLSESQMGRAIDSLNQGLGLYQELGDLWGTGHCLYDLGYASLFVSLVDCRRYFLAAIEVFEQSDDIRSLSQALSWLTVIAAYQGDDETMEMASARYRALAGDLEQPVFLETTLEINAVLAQATGDYTLAIRYHEEICDHLNNLGRARLFIEKVYLGLTYLHANQFDRGREIVRQTLAEFEKMATENDDRLAFTLHILALLSLAEGELEQAKNHLQEAITVYENNKNHIDLAGAQNLLGIILIEEDDLNTARPFIATGLKLALKERAIMPLGEALLGTALLHIQQRQHVEARRLYELVWQLPRYRNSALYDAAVGKKIRDRTAAIPPDDLHIIQEQTATQDIWQEAAALLDKL